MDVLVIGDAHAKPDFNNTRFDLLGAFIIDRKPDVVLSIGDFADMPSLSSYDKGKKSFEGRRYKKDIESAIDAQIRMFTPLIAYNQQRRTNKQKQYLPRTIMVTGNHDYARINRVTEMQPELDGAISTKDLQYDKYWNEVYKFLDIAEVNGVYFSHYFTSGVLGRPTGGEHPCYSMLTKHHVSCVSGHSHLRDFCERTDPSGKRICSVSAGCYLDEDQHEDYAGPANKMWWKGLVMLNNVDDGYFDPEFIHIKYLKERYKSQCLQH